MISLFEISLEKLEVNFARGDSISSRHQRVGVSFKPAVNVYAFFRRLRRIKTAASGLKFSGNNTERLAAAR